MAEPPFSAKFIRFVLEIHMYRHFRKSILASAIALAILGTSAAASAETMSQDVINARQETQIWTTYALSPYLRANDLKVSVDSGKATLTGNVEEGVNKDLAKQIALGVDGIKSVDNQIVVQSDYVAPKRSAARTYGESMDDAGISAAVKSKLVWSKYTDGMTTEVETKSGKVTLRGTADSAASKEHAKSLAMDTRGVVSVDDQLMVKDAKPGIGGVAKTSQDVADGWITTKVKSTYGYSSAVNGSDIAVSTNSGIVTLSGKVDSGAERALAIDLAQNVRGVKSVQSKALTL
jgi:hyperosmotically inducible periplasmic protein